MKQETNENLCSLSKTAGVMKEKQEGKIFRMTSKDYVIDN